MVDFLIVKLIKLYILQAK